VTRMTGPNPALSVPSSATSDYEVLRKWALAIPRPSSAPAGMVLVLTRGLANWLQSRANLPSALPTAAGQPWQPWQPWQPPAVDLEPNPITQPMDTLVEMPMTVSEHTRAFITVLATMVEHARHEQHAQHAQHAQHTQQEVAR
jgi:hypothetical protein